MSATVTQEKTLLATLKEVTFFVAIYLYFIGFVYIFYFYDSFGIPLRSIETPVYYFFVYSYNVIAGLQDIRWASILNQKPLWTFIVAIVVICAILMAARWKTRKRIVLFGLLTVLFPLLFYVARAAAKSDALGVRSQETAKEITFVFKKSTSARASVKILKAFTSGKDEDETSDTNQSTGKARRVANQGSTSDKKVTAGKAAEGGEQTGELVALQRFLDANKRIDVEEKPDPEARVISFWPKLYLVTETSTSFYVILQPSLDTGSLPYGYVYEIAKADVLLSEVKIPQPE